ncbi:MAG: hypothetical protein IT426_14820 [Pirellulales bacterium]|nr:hypothetical protein [Pirellulales bacterium]
MIENPDIPDENRVSTSATLIVAAGVAAAWVAAGSSGVIAHSLRHVVTCIVLGAAAVAGWPTQAKEWKSWVIFAGGIVVAIIMAVVPLEAVNILSVVIILSALAQLRGGLDGRAFLLAAQAVFCFTICHFLYSVCPRFWLAGDYLGQACGWLAGKITGQALSVGATFAGVDFLLLMVFLYGFWLYRTASPRRRRAVCAGLAIIAAQFAYLAVLVYSEKLIEMLPAPIYPVEDDYMRMGAWVWQNALRSMIPWNLPLVALLLQTLVAAMMFRRASWRSEPSVAPDKPQAAGGKTTAKKVASRKSEPSSVFLRFGPAAAAILLAAAATLWTIEPDLTGKTVVAYQSDGVRWTAPQHGDLGENRYGLLPDFVRSLGGKFVFSSNLSREEFTKADVVLLLNPDEKLSMEQQALLELYADRGGSLLVSSDRNATENSRKKLGEILKSSGIRVDRTIATSRLENWEQTVRAMNHPVSLGVDDFRNGFGLESSLTLNVQGSAYPLLTGQWGWNDSGGNLHDGAKATYKAGDRLGDLVLVAEANRLNNGKIVVLGDAACLSNDLLPASYEFVGRLLGYLAQKTPAFSRWRMVGVQFFTIALIFLIAAMRKPSQPAVAALAFAAAVVFFGSVTLGIQRILPSEREDLARRLAFIDESHLEAYSGKSWNPRPAVAEFSGKIWFDQGIGNFARTLARNGYLPLRLRSFAPGQLERGSLLVSMAPGRSYSAGEIEAVRNFVSGGGTLVCMAGAEESRAIDPLLEQFDLRVPHTPAPPRETVREPAPKGSLSITYTKPEDEKDDSVYFFAAWEIDSLAIGSEGEEVLPYIYRTENDREEWFIVSRHFGDRKGCVAAIADTFFAANANPDPNLKVGEANERFWRWFLPRIAGPARGGGEKSPERSPANAPGEEEPIRERGPDER